MTQEAMEKVYETRAQGTPGRIAGTFQQKKKIKKKRILGRTKNAKPEGEPKEGARGPRQAEKKNGKPGLGGPPPVVRGQVINRTKGERRSPNHENTDPSNTEETSSTLW